MHYGSDLFQHLDPAGSATLDKRPGDIIENGEIVLPEGRLKMFILPNHLLCFLSVSPEMAGVFFPVIFKEKLNI